MNTFEHVCYGVSANEASERKSVCANDDTQLLHIACHIWQQDIEPSRLVDLQTGITRDTPHHQHRDEKPNSFGMEERTQPLPRQIHEKQGINDLNTRDVNTT